MYDETPCVNSTAVRVHATLPVIKQLQEHATESNILMLLFYGTLAQPWVHLDASWRNVICICCGTLAVQQKPC
jgi:hypothetical protein